ncbi:MAG TPA: autotransporter assembly complex family protein [Syntrophorhabdaceae bacterium]|nr:autotransporter assembly complex family protein [Syntrophorhabdaceae bacterium]
MKSNKHLFFFKCSVIVAVILTLASLSYAESESLSIAIDGLSSELLKNTESVLKLPENIIKDGKIDMVWLRRFIRQVPQKVSGALQPLGFYKSETTTSLDKTGEGSYVIHVSVKAGEPILIKATNIVIDGPGESEGELKDIISHLPFSEGDILRHDKYELIKNRLHDKAIELGYLDSDFSTHVIDITLSSLSAYIKLVFRTGPKYHFGDVTFVGAQIYPVRFLKRYLDFKPGDVFSYAKIAKTQYNLVGADRFKEVIVNPKKEDAQKDSVPIEVKLVPSPPKRLRFGIGYGTDTGVRGTVKYQDVNFFNSGHQLSTELQASQTLQGLAARYVFPDEKDFRSFTAFTMGLQHEDVSDKTTNVFSLEGEHTRSFGIEQIGSLYVRLQKEHSTAGNERTNTFLMMPGIRYSDRKYDSIIHPTKGYYYDLEFRGAHKTIGSDSNFIQFITNAEIMVKLPARMSFLTRGRFGTSSIDGASEELPISIRFFAGGSRSVRGYSYQSLGPTDKDGNVVGGKNMLVLNFELERAIGDDWGVVAFYDSGNAFNKYTNMDLMQGAGMGIRYYTPIGSLNLDIARQLNVSNPDFKVHFTIGIRI